MNCKSPVSRMEDNVDKYKGVVRWYVYQHPSCHWSSCLLVLSLMVTEALHFCVLSCQQNDQARPVIVAVLVVVCLSYVLIGVKVSSLKRVLSVHY